MNTLKDFFEFIKAQSNQGSAEIRLVATIDPITGNITGYAHPLNKNGDTFDFMLCENGYSVEMTSNPNIKKA